MTVLAVDNIILGGVTLRTERVEDIIEKRLILINIPSSSALGRENPKGTLIVDLLRVQRRLSVRGWVDLNDRTALRELATNNRVITAQWDGETLQGSIEKLNITKDSSEQPERFTQLTFAVGDDYSRGDDD